MTRSELKQKVSLYGMAEDLKSAVNALTGRTISRNSIHLALTEDKNTPLRDFIVATATKMVQEYEASLPKPLPNPGMRVMESI